MWVTNTRCQTLAAGLLNSPLTARATKKEKKNNTSFLTSTHNGGLHSPNELIA